MTGYIKVRVNRLFHGYASVRDYVVMRAKKEHKGLKLIVDNQVMTVEWKDLDKGMENEEVFTSRHNPLQKYRLIDFDYRPDKGDKPAYQFDLFSTLTVIKEHKV